MHLEISKDFAEVVQTVSEQLALGSAVSPFPAGHECITGWLDNAPT